MATKKKKIGLTAKGNDLNIRNPESKPPTMGGITEKDIIKNIPMARVDACIGLDRDIPADLFISGETGKRLNILTFVYLMRYLEVYPRKEDGKLVGLGNFEDTMEFLDYHKLILSFVYKDFSDKAREALRKVMSRTIDEFGKNLERIIRHHPDELGSLSSVSLACHRYLNDRGLDRT
jgi:hypothetical protein